MMSFRLWVSHLEGILAHWRQGLTTAFLEGLNSLFSATKRNLEATAPLNIKPPCSTSSPVNWKFLTMANYPLQTSRNQKCLKHSSNKLKLPFMVI